MVWQLANESHRVGDAIAVAFAHVHLAGQRVDRGEQPVLDEHVLPRERLQETRLAGVGIADERRGRYIPPPLPLIGAMLGHILQPLLERRDFAADDAAVGFELGFAGSAEPDTAADTRQMCPHARQTRQQILELRQLDLELGFVAARPRREDVENHLGAVHHPDSRRLLEILPLHRR